MTTNHKKKYLKYKLKYLQKKQKIMKGGSSEITDKLQEQINIINQELQKLKTQYETHYHETKGIKY